MSETPSEPPRETLKQAFLDTTPWAGAERWMIAGDASNRKYDRLRMGDDTAILMDAPPEKGEDVAPFVAVADYLTGLGLSAPTILARDMARGFLLLEDLGDDLFARMAVADPALETPMYRAAIDALIALHRADPMPGLAAYDAGVMTPLAALAYDWYLAESLGARPDARAEFCTAMEPLLAGHAATDVTILRDYHAENLLWLPHREGAARVGLLDFQDAMLGDPAYDLVSLLMDARRDVPPALADEMIDYYTQAYGLDRAKFEVRYHVVGAQRNLRILGVFARLSRRDGKKHYVDLIPRVWDHLMVNLAHPALAPVAALIKRDLPAPDAQILDRLRR
ncbi:aminoglycoside phosphotransferase family protein [Pseudooceanicola nitratireducens]|uniref:aminoglycoside phosphotransferase family protein n=1 Tax=Pseudooceanicola nitratireducens TaxID=517719 RepID=UPI003C7E39FC